MALLHPVLLFGETPKIPSILVTAITCIHTGFSTIWLFICSLESVGGYAWILVILGVGHVGIVICDLAVRSVWALFGAMRSIVVWSS